MAQALALLFCGLVKSVKVCLDLFAPINQITIKSLSIWQDANLSSLQLVHF